MKLGKTQIFWLLGLIVVVGLGAGLTYYYPTKKVDDDSLTAPSILWELALDKVYSSWKGEVSLEDPHFKKNCPHLYREKDSVPSELKSCRREILYCYLNEREQTIKNQKRFYSLKVRFPEGFLAPDKNAKTNNNLVISLDGEDKKFELNDFCRQVELPQGAYWGDRSSDKSKRIWHTSNVAYTIDRFLVRNIDIREWFLRSPESIQSKFKDKYKTANSTIDWFAPSVDLRPQEMTSYCHFRRAEVLSSHVRASVAFHYGRSQKSLIQNEPPSFNTPDHPFGIRQQDSPQYRLSHGGDKELEATKSDCRLIYGSDCLKFAYYDLFPNSLGWSGVSEIFGGPAEYVVNQKYPRKNLHPSSYYHPISSEVHKAGVRVYWSGKGHRRLDFNFFTEPFFEVSSSKPEDSFDVGFRCMKKRLGL